jgi:RNA polymerase sigma factor (sigma-70 family)
MLFLHLLGLGSGDSDRQWKKQQREDQLVRQLEALRPILMSRLLSTFHALSREDVEDAVQEAFVYTAKTAQLGVKIRNLSAFVRKVAGNRCVDCIRKKHPEDISTDAYEGMQLSAPGDAYGKVLDSALVDQVLSHLSEYEHFVVNMYLIDRRTLKEISVLLTQSRSWKSKGEAQVCRDLKAALRKLRDIVGEVE